MPAGFQVWGSHGAFQVDGDFKHLVLHSVINTTTTQGHEGDSGTIGSRTAWQTIPSISNPIVAVRSGNVCCVGEWDTANSRFRVHTEAGTGTAVSIYIFGEPGAGANYGLQVFNASGQMVFDATHKPMRAVYFQVTTGSGSTTLATGRSYAVIISGGSYMTVTGSGSPFVLNLHRLGASVNGATVAWGGVKLEADYIGVPGSLITPSNASILVVDVTGY
jgi:hypothetical protein